MKIFQTLRNYYKQYIQARHNIFVCQKIDIDYSPA